MALLWPSYPSNAASANFIFMGAGIFLKQRGNRKMNSFSQAVLDRVPPTGLQLLRYGRVLLTLWKKVWYARLLTYLYLLKSMIITPPREACCRMSVRGPALCIWPLPKSWFSGRGWGQQLFTFQSPAVNWIARTSSLNCLSCRNPYQTPHSLKCLPPFHWKPFSSLKSASSHSLPKNRLWLPSPPLLLAWFFLTPAALARVLQTIPEYSEVLFEWKKVWSTWKRKVKLSPPQGRPLKSSMIQDPSVLKIVRRPNP